MVRDRVRDSSKADKAGERAGGARPNYKHASGIMGFATLYPSYAGSDRVYPRPVLPPCRGKERIDYKPLATNH